MGVAVVFTYKVSQDQVALYFPQHGKPRHSSSVLDSGPVEDIYHCTRTGMYCNGDLG